MRLFDICLAVVIDCHPASWKSTCIINQLFSNRIIKQQCGTQVSIVLQKERGISYDELPAYRMRHQFIRPCIYSKIWKIKNIITSFIPRSEQIFDIPNYVLYYISIDNLKTTHTSSCGVTTTSFMNNEMLKRVSACFQRMQSSIVS